MDRVQARARPPGARGLKRHNPNSKGKAVHSVYISPPQERFRASAVWQLQRIARKSKKIEIGKLLGTDLGIMLGAWKISETIEKENTHEGERKKYHNW
jgi:hypothetical protein